MWNRKKKKTKDSEDNRSDRQKRTTSLIMDNLALADKLSNPVITLSACLLVLCEIDFCFLFKYVFSI